MKTMMKRQTQTRPSRQPTVRLPRWAAVSAAASFVYVWKKVEETKGMELEQMDSVAEARLSQFAAVRAAKDKA